MAEKVTWMVLKVDLQCPCCYKKIKKILCKFPQIRDQVYDEQKNLVKISVVCCSPEKIRDKLCCKGRKVIHSIEILEPPKPTKEPDKKKEPEKPKEQPTKPKDTEKPPKPAEKPKDIEKPPKPVEKPKDQPKPAAGPPKNPDPAPAPRKKPEEAAPVPVIPPPVPVPVPVPVPAQSYPVPVGFCCPQCYEGYGGGPCYHGYGRPAPPPPCYDSYYGYGYSYGKGCYVSRCDYFSDENTSGCTIM